jgi:glucose-6-phosphate 1-dehydrogenase
MLTIVIFGASGDLTARKLVPALFQAFGKGRLPADAKIVGVSRSPMTDDQFRTHLVKLAKETIGKAWDDGKWKEFAGHLHYVAGDAANDGGLAALGAWLTEHEGEKGGDRLFYLSVGPELVPAIVDQLGKDGLAVEKGGFRRLVLEKPFGRDLASAKELNRRLHVHFREDQLFRIDHYLGKETVQNILVFRFANGIFENVWNRNYIDHVEITAAESIGIEGRGPFYETAGALRDVVQNHVMELLSFVAMEPPVSFAADAVRAEKVKVWKAVQPIHPADTVRGQYGPGIIDGKPVVGYRQEERVHPRSQTETYAALRLEIENWRWAGVPFYIRAGKRLPKRVTEISIQFKLPPLLLFKDAQGKGGEGIRPNVLSMRIQPDEGITLQFGAKVPGPAMTISKVNMDFSYAESFGKSSANGYERLLLDAMFGDATLFAHRDGVEATWSLMTPILKAWASDPIRDLPNYAAGTWGPATADAMMKSDGRKWRKL